METPDKGQAKKYYIQSRVDGLISITDRSGDVVVVVAKVSDGYQKQHHPDKCIYREMGELLDSLDSNDLNQLSIFI